MPESAFLTVTEAASLLGISRNSAYELVRQKRLPHIRLGRSVRIPRRIFERWIEQQVGIPLQDPAVVS
jgi:excisionase family DNA binding protein